MSINLTRWEIGIPPSVVILSFDDGPNGRGDTTARLLDILAKYRIRALFALLGENAERYPELVRRIHDEGHIIINHGYSDKWAVDMEEDEFRENLLLGEAAIEAALGKKVEPLLYRPQGGFYHREHRQIWSEEGYTLVPGSARAYDAVVSEDEKSKVAREIIEKVREEKGGMVLLHDGRDSWRRMENELALEPEGSFNRSWIPEIVEEIILDLQSRGYDLKGNDISLDIRPWRESESQGTIT
jgi:peptidoglycan/xylan/chitin deacetylase (PgdA/CDA1 family)